MVTEPPESVHLPNGRDTKSSSVSLHCRSLDPIPLGSTPPVIRSIRYKAFNVYRRLFSIVFLANLVALIVLVVRKRRAQSFNLSSISTAAASTILVAVLIRQDYVANLLFRTGWMIPHSTPLWIRARIAKIYHHGGIHSAAGVCGTMWFLLLTIICTIDLAPGRYFNLSALVVSYALAALLLLIVTFAHPKLRFATHNTFEMTHRFAGWTSIALFWVELILLSRNNAHLSSQSLGITLVHEPTFWMLIAVTIHIILPWIQLRKWTFEPEVLSSHAMRFKFKRNLPSLSGLAIAESPLKEWHPFATFPNPTGKGGSMIISNAADWTKRNIQQPSTRYWVKGFPKTGVLSMGVVFKSIVVVTTGSGIGPCLSFLLDSNTTKTSSRGAVEHAVSVENIWARNL
jgi:hypothetical protein